MTRHGQGGARLGHVPGAGGHREEHADLPEGRLRAAEPRHQDPPLETADGRHQGRYRAVVGGGTGMGGVWASSGWVGNGGRWETKNDRFCCWVRSRINEHGLHIFTKGNAGLPSPQEMELDLNHQGQPLKQRKLQLFYVILM